MSSTKKIRNEEIFKLRKDGMSLEKIAQKFNISRCRVSMITKRQQDLEDIETRTDFQANAIRSLRFLGCESALSTRIVHILYRQLGISNVNKLFIWWYLTAEEKKKATKNIGSTIYDWIHMLVNHYRYKSDTTEAACRTLIYKKEKEKANGEFDEGIPFC